MGSRRQAWWRLTLRSTASPRLCRRCQRSATRTAWGAPSRAPSTTAAAINAALTISKGLTAEDTARATAVFACLKLDDTFPPGLAAGTSISSKSSCSVPARVEVRIRVGQEGVEPDSPNRARVWDAPWKDHVAPAGISHNCLGWGTRDVGVGVPSLRWRDRIGYQVPLQQGKCQTIRHRSFYHPRQDRTKASAEYHRLRASSSLPATLGPIVRQIAAVSSRIECSNCLSRGHDVCVTRRFSLAPMITSQSIVATSPSATG